MVLMISRQLEVHEVFQICLILETKLGDDLLSTNQTGQRFPSTIIQPCSNKLIYGTQHYLIAISNIEFLSRGIDCEVIVFNCL